MKKIGVLSMVMIVCLALVGASYAAWTDDITLEESYASGEMAVGFADMGTADPGPSSDDGGDLYPDTSAPGYDPMANGTIDPNSDSGLNAASHTSVNNGAAIGSLGGEDYFDGITETYSGVYPNYTATILYQVGNLGTLPIYLSGVTNDTTGPNPELTSFRTMTDWSIGVDSTTIAAPGMPIPPQYIEMMGHDTYTVDDVLFPLLTTIIDPGSAMSVRLDYLFEGEIDFNDDGEITPDEIMTEGGSMATTTTYTFTQYTEGPAPLL